MATVDQNKITSMLTVKEVSQLLHVHPNTVRRWTHQGILHGYRITSRGDRRFTVDDIRVFLIKYNRYNGDIKKISSIANNLPKKE